MSDKFKVGEVAIYQFMTNKRWDGEECVIAGPLDRHPDPNSPTGYAEGYLVRDSEGSFLVAEVNLRKKRPPEADDAAAHQAMLDCIERAKIGQGVTV